MRTEDDLRAALTALERHAPDPARVLPGARRGWRTRRGRRWLMPRLLMAATAVAAIVVVVAATGTTARP